MNIDLLPVNKYLHGKCMTNGGKVFIREQKTSRTCTYSEFWNEIERFGSLLRDNGVRCGDRILIRMDNSITSLSVFFGSIVAGIIPVPISPKASNSELELIGATSGTVSLVGDNFHLSACQDVSILNMNHLAGQVRKDQALKEVNKMHDPVYVVYTSGSSGTAKEVVITHDNLLSELFSMADAYALESNHCHLCVLPVCHASALYRNILLPLHNGSEVVLLEGFDSDNFWKLIRDEQINFVQLVPSILSELLMTSDNFTPGDQSSLVYVGSASAPHPPELVSRFEQTFGVYVLQGYGMTEATCTISLNPLKMEDRRPGSVGRPISVNNVTVLDDNGRSLHVGKTGRVMVSGRNVALNVSSASIRNRIDAEDPVLETGDLGYVDEDGFLWLVGRETDMIKRGGHRISPVEIENEIMKCLNDVEVAVVGVPHPLLGQDIVVFISDSKFTDLNSRKLLGKIKKTMASYKVPSRLIHVDSLPKLAVGKVDRQRLREDYRKYHCNKYN